LDEKERPKEEKDSQERKPIAGAEQVRKKNSKNETWHWKAPEKEKLLKLRESEALAIGSGKTEGTS